MHSSGSGLSVKYSVGKMSESMILLNEMISKLQKKVYDVSRDVEAMEETPAVCTSSGTCRGNYPPQSTGPRRKDFDRTSRLPKRPKPKIIQEPHLRKLYQRLIDLEKIARIKWLETFMYMSNYMRILRPMAREEFYAAKKFVQRQTLVLEGPYPGLRNDLIVPDNELTPIGNQFEKFRPREKTKRLIAVKNLEFEGPKNEEGLSLSPESIPGYRCGCLEIATGYPPGISGPRRRGQKYLNRGDVYCIE